MSTGVRFDPAGLGLADEIKYKVLVVGGGGVVV
jgi:hypothetical protein